jgi:hypothetical protein
VAAVEHSGEPGAGAPHATSPGTPTRNQIVLLLGTPDETVGAVNEARIQEEHGVEFNERWIYNQPRHEPTRPLARIIYWNRYDLVASSRIERSGQWVREPVAELLARRPHGAGH